MKSVGVKSNILKVSDELKAGLESAGLKQELPPAHVLFREDGESAGVFLVFKGKVLMGVRNLPELDRVFSGGLAAGIARHVYRTSVQPDRRDGGPVGYSSTTAGRISATHARAPRPLPRSNRQTGTRGDLHPVGAGETGRPDGRRA